MGRVVAPQLPWIATGSLGLLLAWASVAAPPQRHASLVLGVLAGLALLAAARMGTARCMESRVVAIAVAVVAGAGVVLTSTVGPPGAPARPVDGPAVVLALTAAVVVALVVLPGPGRVAGGDPYAS